MTKDFYILGTFVNSDSQRETEEDITPQIFKKFISTLQDGDELNLHINSCGGDVYSGISIANFLKGLSDKGIKTTAIIEGLAASIASVVACACDTIKMYDSSILMIHNCWSIVQGNSKDLRKEADTMDKINDSIISFYNRHFTLSNEELKTLMDNETWISGKDITDFGCDAELINETQHFKIAAKLDKFNFKNLPKNMLMKNEEIKPVEEEEKKPETTETEETETVTETTTETTETETVTETEEKEEEKPEEGKEENEKEEPEEKKPENMIHKAEVEKRVSGMQSTMQAKINALVKDYETKIENFKNELKAREEKLNEYENKFINFQTQLEKSDSELKATLSALEEKTNALEMLNSNVNTPSNEAKKTDWRKLKGREFFDYLEKHPEITK